VTQENIARTICVPGYTATVRPSVGYTNGIKMHLLREAHIDVANAEQFELDHVVPLCLGGHPRQTLNLRLQPWPEAKIKDKLEAHLCCLVCSGQVPLKEAQGAIWRDWKAAAKKYTQHCSHHSNVF
jgi:hypothetical protein